MADVISVLKKGGESAARANYKTQIVAEMLTGTAAESFVSAEMIHGTEQEPLARNMYAMRHGVFVDQVGFVIHPTIERSGSSPDGLVNHDGLIEIKCPKTTTHIRWALEGVVPVEHEPQMHFQMACTGRKWCDFVSFDPRLPASMQIFVKRLERNNEVIAGLNAAVEQFLCEVDLMIDRLKAQFPPLEQVAMNEEGLGMCGITDEDIRAVDPMWRRAVEAS